MKYEILKINPKEVCERIINFLKKEFEERNKSRAILGISGGIDSTTCAVLCKKAGLDLYCVSLPYRQKYINETKKIFRFLKLSKEKCIFVDITTAVDAQIKELQKIIKLDKVDKGNIMARQRMIVQYTLARSLGGLVIGTENLSEYYLGYFTLYGDQACDISPIGGLFKTQVYQLASYLKIPKWILKKKPTAGLWKGQTDEEELGFTYKEADTILYMYFVKKYSKIKIVNKGFDVIWLKKF